MLPLGIEPRTSALHLVYHDNISTALYQLSYESFGALKGRMPQLGIEPRTYRYYVLYKAGALPLSYQGKYTWWGLNPRSSAKLPDIEGGRAIHYATGAQLTLCRGVAQFLFLLFLMMHTFETEDGVFHFIF